MPRKKRVTKRRRRTTNGKAPIPKHKLPAPAPVRPKKIGAGKSGA